MNKHLEHITSNAVHIISNLLRALEDDVKLCVIKILLREDMASSKLLTRRLHINYRKLRRNLRPLLEYGIIEEIQIIVSNGRVYRAYRIKDEVKKVLQHLIL